MADDVQLRLRASPAAVLAIGDAASVKAAHRRRRQRPASHTNARVPGRRGRRAPATGSRSPTSTPEAIADRRARRWSRPTSGMPTAALSVLDGLYPDWSASRVEADGRRRSSSSRRQPHGETLGADAQRGVDRLPSHGPGRHRRPRRRAATSAPRCSRLKALLASDRVAPGRRPSRSTTRSSMRRRLRRRRRLDRRRRASRSRAPMARSPAAVVHRRRPSAADAQTGCSPSCAGSSRSAAGGIRRHARASRRTTGRRSRPSTCPASAPCEAATGGRVPARLAARVRRGRRRRGARHRRRLREGRPRRRRPDDRSRRPTASRPRSARVGQRRTARLVWLDIAGDPRPRRAACRATERGRLRRPTLKPYLDALDSVIATTVPGRRRRGHPVLSVTARTSHRRAPHPAPIGRVARRRRAAHLEERTRPWPSASDSPASARPSSRPTGVVVADSRSARDGRAIDTIGHYNPRTDPDRAQRRRGEGQGLARQGRPAVGHRRAACSSSAGVLPGRTK